MLQTAYLACLIILCLATIPIAVYDVKSHTIKNKVVLAITCVSVIPIILDALSSEKAWYITVGSHLLSGLLAFVLMLAVGLYARGGLGGGDIKVLGAIGLWFGQVYASLGVAVISAIAYLGYCGYIEYKYKKQGRKKPKTLAFAPFISIAVFIMTIIVIFILK